MEKELVWNVLYYDRKKDEMLSWNIFDSKSFCEKLLEMKKDLMAVSKYGTFFDQVSNRVKSIVFVLFGNNPKYEVVMKGEFSAKKYKVNIYEQLALNWEHFIKYIIDKIKIKMIIEGEKK